MALKLEKILESMDSFKLNSEVALLENEGLTDLTRAQTRKELHESFNFIKNELIQGGLLEETQTLLANAWTQAIMEDIYVPGMEDDGFGAGDAAALAAGAGVAGAGARYGIPAVKGMYNAHQGFKRTGQDSGGLSGLAEFGKAAAGEVFNKDIAPLKDIAARGVEGNINGIRNSIADGTQNLVNGVENAALKGSIITRNAIDQNITAPIKDVVGRTNEAYTRGTNGLPQQGTYKFANKIGQVVRAMKS